MSKPFRISCCTVLMMVCLRLLIGAHFFSQGLEKLDPTFSSAGFLAQAKGPLAPAYQSMLPDLHGWNKLMATPREDKPVTSADDASPADAQELPVKTSYSDWKSRIKGDWQHERDLAKQHFDFDAEQQKKADQLYSYYVNSLSTYLDESAKEINAYRHDLFRLQRLKSTPIAEQVPFQEERIKKKAAETAAEAAKIKAAVTAMETDYLRDLRELATIEQYAASKDLPLEKDSLSPVNTTVTWLVLGVGVCLILGLFTRFASFAGAAFLLSVILTQPFWIAGTVPTWNQGVELVALLVLATSHVGRWAGLDFFIHALFVAPFSKSKETK